MKKFILKESQLKEFVENKKSEKIFYEILEKLYKNSKFLNENISIKKANQTIIDTYNTKGLLTPKISEMLVKHNIINEKYEIL